MSIAQDRESEGRRVLYAGDAREAQAKLFEAIEPKLREAKEDPTLLARPLRIIVPSQLLRVQLSAHLAKRAGGAALGVTLQTVRALGAEIAARTDVRLPVGEDAFRLLVERRARNETALSSRLADLEGGGAAVAGTVRDLFDALFQEEQVEALEELVREELRGDEASIATSICRVAAQVRRDMAEAGSVSLDQHYAEVAEALRLESALPNRGVYIHGFADATEAVTLLLSALREHTGASLVLELPRDPALPSGPERSARYATRFGERLGLPLLDDAGLAAAAQGSEESAKLRLRAAPDQDAEVRAVCEDILEAVQRGVAHEDIAVVARSLEIRKRPLRKQLEALGIPYATAQKARGSVGQDERRARAFAALLAQGPEAAIDLHFAARGSNLDGDLLLALRSLGIGRFCDVPTLKVEDRLSQDGTFSLPSRRGFRSGESNDPSAEDDSGANEEPEEAPEEEARSFGSADPRSEKRRIDGARLKQWTAEAAQWMAERQDWPERARFDHWSQEVLRRAEILAQGASETASPLASLVRRVLGDIDLVDEFELTREEFLRLFSSKTEGTVFDPFGSSGGGVRVLDATQARSMIFRELHLLALERDVFPRSPAEDPLLRDPVRKRLRELLPGLPLKRDANLEERYLFAQACGSADRVSLSYAMTADARGAPRTPSPFYRRLERTAESEIPRIERAPLLSLHLSDQAPTLRPEREWAVLHGLAQDRPAALAALVQVQASAFSEATPSEATTLESNAQLESAVAGRTATLQALEPKSDTSSLGPFLGRVGPPSADDPRIATRFFVTHFEGVARCSWQAFLEKTLRVERVPDPLEALPVLESWMVGKTVHGAMEKLALEALTSQGGPPKTLAEALEKTPGAPWSAPATEEKRLDLMRGVARTVLREESIPWEGLAEPLAQRALPYFEEVLRLDLDAIGTEVLATEVDGEMSFSVESGGGSVDLTLQFRADEVRRDETGAPLLIDWKTSAPLDKAKTPATREKNHRHAVTRGKSLQTIAYAIAAQELGQERAGGVYVYLKPEAPDFARVFSARLDAEGFAEFRKAFDDAVSTVAMALHQGGLPPRLFDHGKEGEEGAACKWCQVSEACLRGDTGAKRRLADFVQDHPIETTGSPAELAPDVTIARRILDLQRKGRLDPPETEDLPEAPKKTRKAKA